MWQDKPKRSFLPIEKKDFGYVQRATYKQADLYHEEVVELDSPWASEVATETKAYSFLLLGDQNAGKSTFLHSFVYHPDPNFSDLTCVLPILASTFINSRFISDASVSPIDELPFLDTDVARATILLTLEDFLFWLDEVGINFTESLDLDTRYVLLQFIEIGGDHLDSLIEFEADPSAFEPEYADILQKSRGLLKKTQKTIYFANLRNLLVPGTVGEELGIQASGLDKIRARLRFLNHLLLESQNSDSSRADAGQEILLYLSRMSIQNRTIAGRSVGDVLNETFFRLCEKEGFQLRISDIVFTNHLISSDFENWNSNDEQKEVNYAEVLKTLARLFDKKMNFSEISSDYLVVKYILQFWKKKLKDKHATDFWISKPDFADWLENMHDRGSEVPGTIVLQKFEPTCSKLVDIGASCNDVGSHFSVVFRYNDRLFRVSSAVLMGSDVEDERKFRFPITDVFLESVGRHLTSNIPSECWHGIYPCTSLDCNWDEISSKIDAEVEKLWIKFSEDLDASQFKLFIEYCWDKVLLSQFKNRHTKQERIDTELEVNKKIALTQLQIEFLEGLSELSAKTASRFTVSCDCL